MRLQPILLALTALLCGCHSSSGGSPSMSRSFLLAERTAEDGVQTRFRLQPDRYSAPAVMRIETRTLEVAYLGVVVRSLDRAHAQELDVEPWRGVSVVGFGAQSGARDAGVRVGDVLLSIGGEQLSSLQQYQEVVPEALTPGLAVSAEILRRDASGAYVQETIRITPGSRTIDDSTTERIEVEAPEEILKRTGMQVATLDANLAREIGLGDESLALVTGVIAGASAYEEGLRGGDRILACNGEPVATAADVLAALRRGASRLDVLVDGPLGEHRASVGTDEDVDARSRFHIPILIDHSRSVDRTRTSFLDFIFQFGFNYRRTTYDAETREPYESTYLSLFPLGMFEFERSPDKSRNTLFWLITWSTRR